MLLCTRGWVHLLAVCAVNTEFLSEPFLKPCSGLLVLSSVGREVGRLLRVVQGSLLTMSYGKEIVKAERRSKKGRQQKRKTVRREVRE